MTTDPFANTPVGERPSWWPNTSSGNSSPSSGSALTGIQQQGALNNATYGTSMPAGGVAGGKVSPNGLYWINPDGTLASMANKQVTGALANGVDQSYRNIGKGDMFTGTRDGWNWMAGNRMTPDEGSAQANQAALYGFGYRPSGNTADGWNVYNGLGVGAPTGGAQSRWTGDDPMAQFRSGNGWAQQYNDDQLRQQLSTITQADYDLYSPEKQRLIKAILGNTRPDLVWGNMGVNPPAPGNPAIRNNSQYTTNPLSNPLAGFRQWQQRRQQ